LSMVAMKGVTCGSHMSSSTRMDLGGVFRYLERKKSSIKIGGYPNREAEGSVLAVLVRV
jgi:hypothetical protein